MGVVLAQEVTREPCNGKVGSLIPVSSLLSVEVSLTAPGRLPWCACACACAVGLERLFRQKRLPNAVNVNIYSRSSHIHFHLGHLADAFIQSDLQELNLTEEGETTIYCGRFSKDVRRTNAKHNNR